MANTTCAHKVEYLGSYHTPGDAYGSFVAGNYVYAAESYSLMILWFTLRGIEENDDSPGESSLSQNYPNPLNAQTTIQYYLLAQSWVSIDIFDILGKRIETLQQGIKASRDSSSDMGRQRSSIEDLFLRN